EQVLNTTGFYYGPARFGWSPDDGRIAVTDQSTILLLDAASNGAIHTLPDVIPPPPSDYEPTPAFPQPMPTTDAGFTITPAPTFPPPPTYVYVKEDYGTVLSIEWSPDGRALASGDGNYVRIWDIETGK